MKYRTKKIKSVPFNHILKPGDKVLFDGYRFDVVQEANGFGVKLKGTPHWVSKSKCKLWSL